jgi:hypothetical protein
MNFITPALGVRSQMRVCGNVRRQRQGAMHLHTLGSILNAGFGLNLRRQHESQQPCAKSLTLGLRHRGPAAFHPLKS